MCYVLCSEQVWSEPPPARLPPVVGGHRSARGEDHRGQEGAEGNAKEGGSTGAGAGGEEEGE